VSTLRVLAPTAVTTPYGAALVAVGGSFPGVLTDASDTTYMRDDNTITRIRHHVDMGTFTLPANEWVEGCRWSARFESLTGDNTYNVVLVAPAIGGSGTTDVSGQRLYYSSTAQTVTSEWFPDPNAWARVGTGGTPFTQTQIDALALVIDQQQINGNTTRWYEMGVTVVTTTAPVPSATITGTDSTRPVVSVTHTDRWDATITTKVLTSNVATLTTSAAHGYSVGNQVVVSGVDATFDGTWIITATPSGTQFSYAKTATDVGSTAATGTAFVGDSKPFQGYRVRVFTAAQYGATGFDPTTSDATWEQEASITARTAAYPVPIGVDLVNGAYRAYVWTRATNQTVTAAVWTPVSAPAAFTVAVTSAAPAALTLGWDTANQAVTITTTTRGNLIPPDCATAESVVGDWAVTGCTVDRVADTGVHGSYATEITRTSGGTSCSAFTRNPGGTTYHAGVTPGETYLVTVPIKAVTETKSCAATIYWYDAANTWIGTDDSDAISPTVASGWANTLTITATAPAGAVRCAVGVFVLGSPTASAKWRVDGITMTLKHAPSAPAAVYGQGGYGAGFTGFRTLVERSTDGGTTWVQVRAAAGTDQTELGILGERWSGLDYDAPREVTLSYRASLVAGSPYVLTSGMTPVTVATTSDGTWWVKSVTTPTLNRGSVRLETDPTFAVEEQTAVHRPLGRGYPVVVAGEMGGEDGAGTIHTRGATEHAAILALLRQQGTLLLQSPFTDAGGMGLQWFVRMTARSWRLSGVPTEPRRPITVQWVDVGPPTIGA
jgi:hypothetical protein